MALSLPNRHHWLALILMATCLLGATWVKPKATWFEHIGRPSYDKIVPVAFGDWSVDPTAGNVGIIDPQVQDKVASIYTQIVTRVYEHRPTGRRFMLSIAYGDRQTFGNQLHRPESCYSSQGFSIQSIAEAQPSIAGNPLNVSRMHVNVGNRQEFVTYFIRIGDRVLSGPPTALNKARLHMGLNGYIADGLLFRISEITRNAGSTYDLQDNFISQMLTAVDQGAVEAFIPKSSGAL